MIIYVAAPFNRKPEVIALSSAWAASGHECSSRWATAEMDDRDLEACALKDLDDIRRSSVLLLLNPAEWRSEGFAGRHVEFGFALALGKPIVLAGERTNVFHEMQSIHVRPYTDDPNELARACVDARNCR